jgi:hypothetical protein
MLTAAWMIAVALAASPQAASQPAEGAAPSSRPGVQSQAPSAPVTPGSLTRIRRQLERKTPTESERFENFRLLTSLNVYGAAPRFELFSPGDAASPYGGGPGPVRYGGMTHQEFLSQVTPREFRPPVMNLSSGLFSLSTWLSQRESQRRKDAEARKK